jgi:hypothetical protein
MNNTIPISWRIEDNGLKRIVLPDHLQFVALFLEHDVQNVPQTCDELIAACRTATDKSIFERTGNSFKIHIQDGSCEIVHVWENKLVGRVDAVTMIQILVSWKNMISIDKVSDS